LLKSLTDQEHLAVKRAIDEPKRSHRFTSGEFYFRQHGIASAARQARRISPTVILAPASLIARASIRKPCCS